ncbi:MAG: site-specific DNA-methyltransferase [Armatimonadetes bacterium]|nr:site-specific DNA-methyltransferase [Armatimonadota bacterium]
MSDRQTSWGPDNPHPLSRMKTELVWEGKYDEYGNRRAVKLPETPLPLQRIETIDEPRDRARVLAARQGDLFDQDEFHKSKHRDDFRNMLIWGDNKLALAALLKDFRGQVDLIYIDPPFDVKADFTMEVDLGEGSERQPKEQSILEAVAYRDMWGEIGDAYPQFMYERLALARDLLSSRGAIYLHCDWRMSGVLRSILEDSGAFGTEGFLNNVVWVYGASARGAKAIAQQFARNHDDLFYFRKSTDHKFFGDALERAYTFEEAKKAGFRRDDDNRWFKTAPRGDYTDESVEGLRREGRIHETRTGNIRIKYFLEERNGIVIERVPAGDSWMDIPDAMHLPEAELTGYDTQKPEALLGRVVRSSCPDGGLILDFFCGSGTTCAVAEKLGRRWIGVDLGRYAVHTTRKRLVQVQRELHQKGEPYRSFDVYNLGRYERQWWQMDRLKGSDDEHRALVLKFYRATPLANPPHPALHATKAGAYVHVDEIDGLLSFDELRDVAKAVANVAGIEDLQTSGLTPTGKRVKLTCLAWEFEMDLRLRAQALEAQYGLEIQLTYIPREIMEANRNEIQFFDAGAVDAEPVKTQLEGKTVVDVKLTGFFPALTEVPDKEMEELRDRAVRSPFDFIDFWAVDFEHADGKPFEHHWQDFRTRKDRSLKTTSTCQWQYDTRGKKRICVKVIDVFGVDTTKVIEVDV